MKKVEQLKTSIGSNIMESMGARPHVEGSSALRMTPPPPVVSIEQRKGRTADKESGYMRMEQIVCEEQVRTDFPEAHIERLAKSIDKVGLLQPITVRWSEMKQKHVVVAGECRFRAMQKLGRDSIRVTFDGQERTEQEQKVVQLMENCVREDLNEIDRARSFKELQTLNEWTVQEVADAVCVAKSTVSRCLSLLTLDADQQVKVQTGVVAANTAQQITKVKDGEARAELFSKVEREKLTRDEAKDAVAEVLAPAAKTKKPGKPSAKKSFKLEACKVTFTFPKKRVTQADLQAAYEQLGALLEAS